MSKRPINNNFPLYFLLADFGQFLSNFFLVSISQPHDKFSVDAHVQVSSFLFKTKSADKHFKQIILDLERISKRKLMSRSILLIMKSEKKGVQGISFVSNDREELADKVKSLEVFKFHSEIDALRISLKKLSEISDSFNYVQIDFSKIHYACFRKGKFLELKSQDYRDSFTMSSKIDLEKVIKWLPFEMDLIDLENYIANKNLYPRVLPLTVRDSFVEQALIKEALQEIKNSIVMPTDERIQKVLFSGIVLNQIPVLEQIMMFIMDGLDLTGISYMYFDRQNIFKVLSSVCLFLDKGQQKKVFSQVMPHDFTTIRIRGAVVNNKIIGKVIINQGFKEKQELSLSGGNIYHLPLQGNLSLHFFLNPMCGIFRSQIQDKKDKQENIFEIEVIGGKKGVIFDTRVYPLSLLGGGEEKKQILNWNQAMNIYQKIQKI